MAENSNIEWTDHTFNPWMGCQKVSPACDHCYAEVNTAVRSLGVQWGPGAERRRTSAANWKLPERWNAEAARLGIRYRVFCASLADVFDNAVPKQWRFDLLNLIADTPNLDWLLLTKRIGNAKAMLDEFCASDGHPGEKWTPWPNVWIGATICNQAEADRDIPKLLQVPARVRFLSMEPLLGPVDLTSIPLGDTCASECCGNARLDVLKGASYCGDVERDPATENDEAESRIDWVIVGGESGHHARPMHPDWARSLRDQCVAAGVPFLFKQHGEWAEVEGDYQLAPDDAEAEGYNPKTDCVITPDGRVFSNPADLPDDLLGRWMHRAGKKAAGRLLDGRTWDGVPT